MACPALQNVGIVAMEVYFPQTYVNQEELEEFDKASKGKYTLGLGQLNMAFTGDREDIISICLTAVKSLMDKYNIPPTAIGRLEVGTETIVDKSKSVKSSLMDLFKESGNTNLEGVDNINACYGGTNALFNSIQWVESSYWDGRLAMVVAGDIAVYAEGNARPTGGCGVVVMVIGPNAPIVIDQGLRGVHMENVYDFYKPVLDSEYPVVDGKLSNNCYLKAMDICYNRYRERFQKKEGRKFTVDAADYFVFHAPYNKLVQKSFGRCLYNDFLQEPDNPKFRDLGEFRHLGLGEDSYNSPKLEQTLSKVSKDLYNKKVTPGTVLPRHIGNAYCGSLYAGLVSVISELGEDLVGKRVVLFSYGSGLAATFFSVMVRSSTRGIVQKMDMKNRLQQRIRVPPAEFVKTLHLREKRLLAKDYTPTDPIDRLASGTYYLTKVDDKYRRTYARKLAAAL